MIFGTKPIFTGVGPPRVSSLRKRCKIHKYLKEEKNPLLPRQVPVGPASSAPRPRPLASPGGESPEAGAEALGGVGAAAFPTRVRGSPSHGPASVAAGGIEDGGLRRPPRVCPVPAPAAAGPNLRYTCELASCPGAPTPRANRAGAALHPKCGI